MTKTVIWILAVLGLLPATLLSIAYLVAIVSSARLTKEQSDLGDVSIQIGWSSTELHMSTQLWPAALVLSGVLAVVVGLFFLLPRQPDRVSSGGFLKMESYIGRLLRSEKKSSCIIVSTLDGQSSLLVMRQAGQTMLLVSADRTKNDGQEEKMREFFKKIGMTPSREYRSANGGVEDARCCFEFQLTGDPKDIAKLCVSAFTDLFGVTDQHGLEFTTHGL
ncbi:MAG: hypothetical protein ABSG04_11020 [Verrucomicrobiota bacterium]